MATSAAQAQASPGNAPTKPSYSARKLLQVVLWEQLAANIASKAL
jgi:hypothetical protein